MLRVNIEGEKEIILKEDETEVFFNLAPHSKLVFKHQELFALNYHFTFECEKNSSLVIVNQYKPTVESTVTLDINLIGSEANCEQKGTLLHETSLLFGFNLKVHHKASNTRSSQVFKAVLEGEAKAFVESKIIIDKNLKEVKASQLSKNLVLSEKAKIDVKPELEILSQDVKCSHGVAIGRLREDELFYLMSRGLSRDKATSLLKEAFLKGGV